MRAFFFTRNEIPCAYIPSRALLFFFRLTAAQQAGATVTPLSAPALQQSSRRQSELQARTYFAAVCCQFVSLPSTIYGGCIFDVVLLYFHIPSSTHFFLYRAKKMVVMPQRVT